MRCTRGVETKREKRRRDKQDKTRRDRNEKINETRRD